ncbi:MAG: serine/threonine-protein phosphatase [Ruminococcus sp.]|nr:serine/threonine-protein phosphatase [Ruminococcus sp.]
MSIYNNNTQAPSNMPDAQNIPHRYNVIGSTHEGKVRSINEDNFTINGIVGLEEGTSRSLRARGMGEPLLCAVFDGTGGTDVGPAASRLAAEYATWMYNSYVQSPSDRERLMTRYVSECNSGILEKFYYQSGRRGATTFVMAIINNGRLYAYSLGDSRLYLHTGGSLYLVSNDHTVAMDKYRQGIYTREQAQNSSDRHKLTAFLGIEPASAARAEKYEPIALQKGDSLVLCSDGLFGMVTDGEIADVLNSDVPDKACELIDLAVMRGGKDNVTCIVIECTD